MGYQSGYNTGWANGEAAARSNAMLDEQRDRVYSSGSALNLVIFVLILAGTAIAVAGVRAWIHDMPFFVHHHWASTTALWTTGLISYSLLFALREVIRTVIAFALSLFVLAIFLLIGGFLFSCIYESFF